MNIMVKAYDIVPRRMSEMANFCVFGVHMTR